MSKTSSQKRNEIKIKKAKKDDYEEIYKIVNKAFSEYKKNKNNPDLEETPADVLKDIENDIVLVLSKNKKIVGSLRLNEKEKRKLYLKKFAILPEFQNQGFGTLLFEKAEQIAEKSDKKEIYLYSSLENQNLVDFYKNLDFECVEQSDQMGYHRGLWVKVLD